MLVTPSGALGTLPIDGEILIAMSSKGAALTLAQRAALVEFALNLAVELAREAKDAGAPANIVEAYTLNLALLGRHSGPHLPTAGGGMVDVPAILREIREHGAVWFSEGSGAIDGAFPGATPAFVLQGPSSLLDVMRARMPAAALREVGGSLEAKASLPSASSDEASRPERAEERPSQSFFARLREGLGALFAAEEPAPPSTPSLRASLAGANRSIRTSR